MYLRFGGAPRSRDLYLGPIRCSLPHRSSCHGAASSSPLMPAPVTWLRGVNELAPVSAAAHLGKRRMFVEQARARSRSATDSTAWLRPTGENDMAVNALVQPASCGSAMFR